MANETNDPMDITEDLRDEISEQAQQLVNDIRNGQEAAFKAGFEELHGFDQAQFYLNLPSHFRQQVIDWVAPTDMAEIFDEMDMDEVDIDELLQEMSPQYAAQMIDQMYSDNSVDLLTGLKSQDLDMYLDLMPNKDAQEIRQLLEYKEDTAGALMGHEFVSVNEKLTIKETMEAVKKAAEEAEQITYIYVVDDTDDLVGVVSLRTLILAQDQALVSDVMDTNIISVEPDEDQQDVARIMADYNFTSLPVVTDNKLLGIIMVDDIVDVIDEEAAEDYSRLAGVDVVNMEGNPLKSAMRRLPWLIGLIFLGMGTASVIDGYNDLVQIAPILAVFISLITGTAGNAGTQSLAVAVRRLALNETSNLWRMLLTEVLIGLIIGVSAGITIFAVVSVWKQNTLLGVAVGLAMAAAILVANVAGAFIPLIMDSIGVDPAVASGPFISTLSDLTSVIIYFNIAKLFIDYFSAV
ncbi:magnesium transporter [Weissella ceti]|uniref:Magnesium transporter MgtE n=1 Tax=Weissella ceti TaxID=759620 RepID=A0ABT3E4H5_9LACO|nr:magnesium transporter [Weissella ceti]MCW0952807.1 magnesium transporter [Weissella ceti]QVK12505.1 magnesium transporter [Weissella ceti]